QVSVSHEVSPLIKLVSRGDTTVVDAYLSPILRRYVAQVAEELGVTNKSLPSAAPIAEKDSATRFSPPLRRRDREGGRANTGPETPPPHVQDVIGRAHRGRTVPRQGRNPLGSRRRRGRHGADRPRRRLRSPHRLRHGRYLDRRLAFRWRARAHI